MDWLPHVNASLNTLATFLLITGFVLIKRRQEKAHKTVMLSAFATSVVFLICYLIYHANVLSKKFPSDDYSSLVSYTYYTVLLTHVVLAAFVPILAVTTIVLGLLEKRSLHRWWAKFTFPIWLYVSITGVFVYLMLYHWCTPITDS